MTRKILRLFTAGDGAIALVAVAIVVYYCSTRGIFQGKASGDGYFGFTYLPGLFHYHTFDFAPNSSFWVRYLGHEKTGHVANPCPIGPIFFWIPFYLLGLGLAALSTLLGIAKIALFEESPFHYWMAGLGSLAAGLVGVALMYRLLARHLSVGAARFGAIGATLASPLVWYFVTQPLYQHATAFFMVTLLVERWDAWRSAMTPRRWALLGAIGGVAMLMRFQEGMWLLLPGLDLARDGLTAIGRRHWDALGRVALSALLFVGVALVCFAPQLALWHWYYGFFRPAQPPGHMRWLEPGLVATLFSTRAGLFPWIPMLYLVLPGLWLARRQLQGLGGRMVLLFAVEVWVNSSAWDHWGSWAYGPRRFTDATVVYSCGLAGFWTWIAERRMGKPIAAAIAALTIAWNGLLMELVRNQKTKSSGAMATPASTWVGWAHGPRWLAGAFDRFGFPFCQPAGWIYGWIYGVPVRTFEGIVGNYILDRDSKIHAVRLVDGLDFASPGEFVREGITGPAEKGGLVPVADRVRLLVPLAAREPLRMTLSGEFQQREGEVKAQWNGQPLPSEPHRGQVLFEVPKEIVKSRSSTNDLWLYLPPGARLKRLGLDSTTSWWQ